MKEKITWIKDQWVDPLIKDIKDIVEKSDITTFAIRTKEEKINSNKALDPFCSKKILCEVDLKKVIDPTNYSITHRFEFQLSDTKFYESNTITGFDTDVHYFYFENLYEKFSNNYRAIINLMIRKTNVEALNKHNEKQNA